MTSSAAATIAGVVLVFTALVITVSTIVIQLNHVAAVRGHSHVSTAILDCFRV
eukprot:CAMPEP_0201632162 /NCGR_PEP_ID=MMETSP0493-20130528/5893_1 /ASSEMBLY_ACC=CAM_ASM_000838 /TAXON_ID=420259 /ORGANISM="Thalassiosira gravida, Strain GMp14c1" /LENGTH=52 /DNA_ID=CAMNT_0048103625 /DNA_START=1818 /DNA_END=1976 /DNA_ORIENTATION=-